MSSPFRLKRCQIFVCLIVAAALAGGCSGDLSSSSAPNLRVANAQATTTSSMSVSSTSPDSATQDTTLDVVINGSGFVSGTSAYWALAGVQDPTQVSTNSTRYVSSRRLVANITISKSATVAKWDVVVAAGTKGGIGTEAFAIKPHPVASSWMLPLNSTGLGLRSDGAQSDGTYSVYSDSVCSVSSAILEGGSGDAIMQTNNPTRKQRTCSGRTMTVVYPPGDVVYPNGGTETMLVFLNIRNISNLTTTIPIGYANRVERQLALNPTQTERCDAWRWANTASIPGDYVWVERMSLTTYHVYTKDHDPDPTIAAANVGKNKALCTTTGQMHHLTVDLYVVAKENLP